MAPKILITVDTEALPSRSNDSHIEKLIWGNFPNGRAGIKEMVSISKDIGVPFLFFLEIAGAELDTSGTREVASYLDRENQDVELHFHPEILGKNYWRNHGLKLNHLRQDLFSEHESYIMLRWAALTFQNIFGKWPRAYRAGSFRWNRGTIKSLEKLSIEYSFNCCRETSCKENYSTYTPAISTPFIWGNGVKEIPCSEFEYAGELIHLRYPRRIPNNMNFIDLVKIKAKYLSEDGLIVLLLHSWSFLERSTDNGFYYYKNSKALDNFYKFISQASHEFEIIGFNTAVEFLGDQKLPTFDLSDIPQ